MCGTLSIYLVRILDGSFRWYVRTRVTSSTSRMPSKQFVWNVVYIYIWFESWTAAFADTFEPDWPPPRLACYSPTYHSSLFYFVSYNHNHNMNAIINIQFIFECTICSFYITLLDGSNMIHPSKHETFTQCWYNVGPGVHIVPKLGECFLGQSQRLAQS